MMITTLMSLNRGLINNGATCYMNASLQAIFSCASPKEFLLSEVLQENLHQQIIKINDFEQNVPTNEQAVHTALQQLFAYMQFSLKDELSTKVLCKTLGFKEEDFVQQQDANEFIKRIIDKIEQSTKKFDNANRTNSMQHFKTIFEGSFNSTIQCTSCGNQSVQISYYQDFMLDVKPNFFEGLAKMLLPEKIEQYNCQKCHRKVNAAKYVTLSQLPSCLVMTLQRFIYDYQGNLNKNSSPSEFPLALDFSVLNQLNIEQLLNQQMIRLLDCSNDTIVRLASMLQAILAPWLCFKINGNKIQALDPAFEVILRQQNIKNHILQYYNCEIYCPFKSGETVPKYLYLPKFQQQVPPQLLYLKSIICHAGNLQGGHYYTLALKQKRQQMIMVEFNDRIVTKVQQPINQLQYIGGLSKNLTQDDELENLKKKYYEDYKPTIGFGNTGYMYFYENANSKDQKGDIMKTMLPNEIKQKIVSQNMDIESSQPVYEINIVTNYSTKQITPFSEYTELGEPIITKIKSNFRKTSSEVVKLLIQEFKIPNNFVYKQTILHQCNLYRPQDRICVLSFDAEKDNDMLDELLEGVNFFGRKQLNLFVEFVINGVAEYDYSKIYIPTFGVKIEKSTNLLSCDNIGFEKKLVPQQNFYIIFDQEQLQQAALKWYKSNLNIPDASREFNVALLKVAICQKINQNANKIILYVRQKSGISQVNMNGTTFGTDTQRSAYVPLDGRLYFEITQNPLPQQLLEGNSGSAEELQQYSQIATAVMNEKQVCISLNDEKGKELQQYFVSRQVTIEVLMQEVSNAYKNYSIKLTDRKFEQQNGKYVSVFLPLNLDPKKKICECIPNSQESMFVQMTQDPAVQVSVQTQSQTVTLQLKSSQLVSELVEMLSQQGINPAQIYSSSNQQISFDQYVTLTMSQLKDKLKDLKLKTFVSNVDENTLQVLVNNNTKLDEYSLQISTTFSSGQQLKQILAQNNFQFGQYNLYLVKISDFDAVLKEKNLWPKLVSADFAFKNDIQGNYYLYCDKKNQFQQKYDEAFPQFAQNKQYMLAVSINKQVTRFVMNEGIKCHMLKPFLSQILNVQVKRIKVVLKDGKDRPVPDTADLTQFIQYEVLYAE